MRPSPLLFLSLAFLLIPYDIEYGVLVLRFPISLSPAAPEILESLCILKKKIYSSIFIITDAIRLYYFVCSLDFVPQICSFTFKYSTINMSSEAPTELKKKPVSFSNILLGAGLNLCEATSLGQPLEVVKTTMAANRDLTILQSAKLVWSRGGVLGFYQGLIPWAWIEASTKGAVLLFVSAEAEYQFKKVGASNFGAGIGGGIIGGLAQAYLTMGFCTCMKTVEITRSKQAHSAGAPQQTSFQVFKEIYKKEGIRGINKGVNAVAIRQCTNWGSRFGLSRLAEDAIKNLTGKSKDEKLSSLEKITASAIGGGLSAWNQPIEVIRVEMQSKTNDPNRPKNLSVFGAAKYIYKQNGIKGLYRGVTPRIGLGIWQTIFMVGFGDMAKDLVEKLTGEAPVAKH